MLKLKIEEIFSSKGRIKILLVLLKSGELNISEISRRTGLNYATVNRHLKILEDAGLVVHRRFGRIRLYQIDKSDKRVQVLEKLISVWK